MKRENFNLDKLHKVQLSILLEFDRVCKKYNLTYFLAYGTLLGALRHNGFIPWDDDIDTCMPYEDYLKLRKIDASEWKHPFFLQNYDTDKNFKVCFSKLRNSDTTLITTQDENMDINHGVDIDIYPLIHLADDKKKQKRQYIDAMMYFLLRADSPPVNHGFLYYYGAKCILFAIPNGLKKRLTHKLKKRVTKYQKEDTRHLFLVTGNIELLRQKLESKWFQKIAYHTFEGYSFSVPNGAKEWMASRYGADYMKMPPKELRGAKLDVFVKVDLEKPYTEYKGVCYCSPNKKARKVNNDRLKKFG